MEAKSPFDLALRIPNFEGYSPPESGSGNSTPHRVVGFSSTKVPFACKTPTSVLTDGGGRAVESLPCPASAALRHSSLTDLLLHQGVPRPGKKLSIKVKSRKGSGGASYLRRSQSIAVGDLGNVDRDVAQKVDSFETGLIARSRAVVLPAETLPSTEGMGNHQSFSVTIPRASHAAAYPSPVDQEVLAAALQVSPYGTPRSPSHHLTFDSMPSAQSETTSSYGTPHSSHSWLMHDKERHGQHAQQPGVSGYQSHQPGLQPASDAQHDAAQHDLDFPKGPAPQQLPCTSTAPTRARNSDEATSTHGEGSGGGSAHCAHKGIRGRAHATAHPSASTSCLERPGRDPGQAGQTTRQLFQARAEATTAHAQVECLREALLQEQLRSAWLEEQLERVTEERDRLRQRELRREARARAGRQGGAEGQVGSWPPLGRLQLLHGQHAKLSRRQQQAPGSTDVASGGRQRAHQCVTPPAAAPQGRRVEPQFAEPDGQGGEALNQPSPDVHVAGAEAAGVAGRRQGVGEGVLGGDAAGSPIMSPLSGSSVFEFLSTLSIGPLDQNG